ncbi:MAG TPA: YHS domain-containing (seleno)protein [Cyclobacteriaceae bacterium]|nr:YHS domain-containing (seleno)protein [Cyclobacteriaceae bacterium]
MRIKVIFLSVCLILTCRLSQAQVHDVYFKNLNLRNSIALEGFDPLSYFSGQPQKGNKDIHYKFRGAEYHFISSANRQAFISDPYRYLPEYGGWCAFAMGDSGDKVDVDPKTFKIIHGKLYLFYNKYFNNTLVDWNENEDMLKKEADRNWNKILNQHQ